MPVPLGQALTARPADAEHARRLEGKVRSTCGGMELRCGRGCKSRKKNKDCTVRRDSFRFPGHCGGRFQGSGRTDMPRGFTTGCPGSVRKTKEQHQPRLRTGECDTATCVHADLLLSQRFCVVVEQGSATLPGLSLDFPDSSGRANKDADNHSRSQAQRSSLNLCLVSLGQREMKMKGHKTCVGIKTVLCLMLVQYEGPVFLTDVLQDHFWAVGLN